MEEDRLVKTMQEAKERYDAARWGVSANAIEDTETIRVHISRGGITFTNNDIFVRAPNWIERRFKITFEDKVTKAINVKQKECDILNARMRRTAELDVMAEVMLTIAEAKREGKTITLGDIEKKK